MSLATAELPTDPAALRAFALACQDELKAAELAVQYKTLEIEKLKFQIAKLRRMQFGRSSERINRQIAQLELRLEELESGAAEDVAKVEAANPAAPVRVRNKPTRKPLPDHLPRQEGGHQPTDDGACTCPACGRGMSKLGEDVTEVLDYVPGHFQVIRHVRLKYACDACDAITQAPAPAMPTPRGRATPGLLAHLLVAKYCDHLPLHRQAEIYAREGLDVDRSTLCDWVGQAAWLLDPVVAGIQQHVFAGAKIHGDDTTVPVLTPGLGRTKTGRLWVYVRDDRPFCGDAPPAAAYFYSPDRGGERPAAHMANFTGFLQADGYSGFQAMYHPARTKPGPIIEIACWAHTIRTQSHFGRERMPWRMPLQRDDMLDLQAIVVNDDTLDDQLQDSLAFDDAGGGLQPGADTLRESCQAGQHLLGLKLLRTQAKTLLMLLLCPLTLLRQGFALVR